MHLTGPRVQRYGAATRARHTPDIIHIVTTYPRMGRPVVPGVCRPLGSWPRRGGPRTDVGKPLPTTKCLRTPLTGSYRAACGHLVVAITVDVVPTFACRFLLDNGLGSWNERGCHGHSSSRPRAGGCTQFRPSDRLPREFSRSAGKRHKVWPEFDLLASRRIFLLTHKLATMVYLPLRPAPTGRVERAPTYSRGRRNPYENTGDRHQVSGARAPEKHWGPAT